MSSPTPPFRYVSPQAVIDVIAPDGDEAGTAADLETAIIIDEIQAAEDRIDAALGSRYALPLNPVPGVVIRIARDLAAFNADMSYRGQAEYSQGSPLLMRFQQAEARLKELASGQAELGQPEPPRTGGSSAGRARNLWAGRLFDPNDPTAGDGSNWCRQPSRWDLDHLGPGWR